MKLDAPRMGWIVALAISGVGGVWHQYGQIQAMGRDLEAKAAESADYRAWRLSVEQALRNCRP